MSPILDYDEKLFLAWQKYFQLDFEQKRNVCVFSQQKLSEKTQTLTFRNLIKQITNHFRWIYIKDAELSITEPLCQQMGYFCENKYENGIIIWRFGLAQ